MRSQIQSSLAALAVAAATAGFAQGQTVLFEEAAGTSVNPGDAFHSFSSGVLALPAFAIGEDLTFSVNATTASNASADDLVYIQLNVDGVNSASAGFGSATTFTGTPTPISLTLAIAPGAVEIEAFLIYADGAFSGIITPPAGPTISFEDFVVSTAGVAVPEPASLALLGLGGLAMLRRRRTA